jgi:hypothetical protein
MITTIRAGDFFRSKHKGYPRMTQMEGIRKRIYPQMTQMTQMKEEFLVPIADVVAGIAGSSPAMTASR